MSHTEVTLPRPVQFVLDDVGWREGWNLSAQGGPYRAGMNRLLGPADYHAVAGIGEALTIRPQCAMVMCEWDKENVCADYPTATQAGRNWDNSTRVGPWADESAHIFVDRAAHIEFGIHGVGHEHWENGRFVRAEWFGRTPEERWPWEVLQGHLECFRRILAQYDLDPAQGIAFPPSFVPCAFRYYWDDADPESTGALMRTAGVRFCSTPYSSCCFAGGPPDKPDGGFDHGLIVLDRGNSGVPWYVYATAPKALPTTSICGIHWPNVLMPDPDRNGEAVRIWVDYLRGINRADGLMLARSMHENVSQWLFHSYATLTGSGGQFVLDATGIPEVAWKNNLVGNPILKLAIHKSESVPGVRSDDCRAVAYWEADGAAYVALRLGGSRRCAFGIEYGEKPISPIVVRNGTYDVLDLQNEEGLTRLRIRMSGRQTVHLRLPRALRSVESGDPGLAIHGFDDDRGSRIASFDISGRDIHGSEGDVRIAC